MNMRPEGHDLWFSVGNMNHSYVGMVASFSEIPKPNPSHHAFVITFLGHGSPTHIDSFFKASIVEIVERRFCR